MNLRLKNIRKRLEERDLDCLILTNPANISYLVGFNSRDSYFLVSKKKNIYFTDFRYLEEARHRLKGNAALSKIDGSVFELLAEACSALKARRIGFEENVLSFAQYKKIRKALGKKARLVPAVGIVEDLRRIKDKQELQDMRKAIRITIRALKFIKAFIKPGRTELEIVAELERFIRRQGATGAAFDIIVASGLNSSYPHHASGGRKIRKNEPVLVDIGVDNNGYKSDLTRVFFLGKINVLAQKISEIVLEAQKRAIYSIKAGIRASEVDAASRKYIASAGFGKFFGHSLGHGVGLEVHEKPRLSSKDNSVLMPGEVFTIEPAIYLPAKFGIRIEDMVLVTNKGCEVLSGAINQ